MPGVLDVLPTTQSIDQSVMMDRIEYQGQSCLLLAATDAHMTLMIDLMLRCESDSGCNVNRSTLLMPALPVIIADEDIDTKTKMKTKMVKVPVRDEIGLSESVDTFIGLVWISSKQKLVGVKVIVSQAGDQRHAIAVMGPTSSERVADINSLELNLDVKTSSSAYGSPSPLFCDYLHLIRPNSPVSLPLVTYCI